MTPLNFGQWNAHERMRKALFVLRDNLRAFCAPLQLELEPVAVHRSIHHRAAYLKAVIAHLFPDHLSGYGPMPEDEKSTVEKYARKILANLQELSECFH